MQVTNDKGTPGAKVVEVVPNGAAAAAGLPSGVVVTKIDDRPVNSADGFGCRRAIQGARRQSDAHVQGSLG